ncbi:uridine-cytidine kinase 2-like [Corticium candelabrum]|uniref:uridine-cytidine kinase 2-like n=1 Tax=Corticium candelabrum TaxID=121492 RepID=UPI002E254AFF|nr:uridine-cytidine kinase 2-like [Corticium candelabrum]
MPPKLCGHAKGQTAKVKKPLLIGVTGGTGSGKSTVCEEIVRLLGEKSVDIRKVCILHEESFYKELNEEEQQLAEEGLYNFDHPDAFDEKLMLSTLEAIVDGKAVQVPVYDVKTNSRTDKVQAIEAAEVVLLEGILVLYSPDVRNLLQMKLFVDLDSDSRLARRVMRDVQERGRSLEQVLDRYSSLVKPAFEDFTLPTKKYADIIIPRGSDNKVAIDVIVEHLREIISTGEIFNIRRRRLSKSPGPDTGRLPERTRKLSESGLRPH